MTKKAKFNTSTHKKVEGVVIPIKLDKQISKYLKIKAEVERISALRKESKVLLTEIVTEFMKRGRIINKERMVRGLRVNGKKFKMIPVLLNDKDQYVVTEFRTVAIQLYEIEPIK